MNIVVNEELKAYIDPLTPEEHDALERSILAEGCRDALVLWGDLLVDGHNDLPWAIREFKPAPNVWERFVRAVRKGEPEAPDIGRGAQVQSLLDACERSAASSAASSCSGGHMVARFTPRSHVNVASQAHGSAFVSARRRAMSGPEAPPLGPRISTSTVLRVSGPW